MAKRVVILGAGYGGVRCALTLGRDSKNGEVNIMLVDKHSYHQFVTQLHESAVGISTNQDMRVSLEDVFDGKKVRLIKDTILSILPKDNRVILEKGTLDYDYLVVGLGSEPEYFNIPGIEQYGLTLRSLNSSKLIKTHIENKFAKYKEKPQRRELLTVVIGGAGFTGIELTGEMADWLPELAEEYDLPRDIVSVVCIEASSSILNGSDRHLIENAYGVLRKKGVTIITEVSIEAVTENEVKLSNGETVPTATFIWTGGMRANKLIAQAGLATSVRGRASVNKYLQAAEYPNVYLVGDNAFIVNPQTGDVMGPTAQVAIQSGQMAAENILSEIREESPRVFYPHELGRVVSLGRNVAVGKIGKRYKPRGKIAGLLKEAIQWKYLYSIGGLKLVAKKLLK